MDIAQIARMVFALAIVLGLIGLLAVAARRFGPEALRRLQTNPVRRRLTVVETLVLDPSRRLVLVRCDDEEKLTLLGDGRLLGAAPASAAAKESM
jgi:flagellar protein FliO/FliZ